LGIFGAHGWVEQIDQLAFEGAGHCVGVFRNDRQQHLSRLVRAMRTLLPIADGAEWQMEPRCKLLLRQNP
jgi:hypothetical protein